MVLEPVQLRANLHEACGSAKKGAIILLEAGVLRSLAVKGFARKCAGSEVDDLMCTRIVEVE